MVTVKDKILVTLEDKSRYMARISARLGLRHAPKSKRQISTIIRLLKKKILEDYSQISSSMQLLLDNETTPRKYL